MPIRQQPQERRLKGKMDIVICLDATGSMESCIEQLKNNLSTFIGNLTIKSGSQQIAPEWRARLIYFRDLDADSEAIVGFDFVNSEEELSRQINQVRAEGGGDDPESILDAIYTAIAKSNWREGVLHAVIAFTDAPPKERLHKKTIEAGEDASVGNIINKFTADRYSRLWVFCPSNEIYKELEAIPRSNITYVDSQGDVYQGLSNLDFNKLLQELGKTLVVSASEIVRA
ncbi:MAG: VWA domain-containing protein [Candidatus Saccharicenans sp.]|jgi:hypothetical protein|nr:VWA domain-containing protein [Candidatus Saccharicenans sp.]